MLLKEAISQFLVHCRSALTLSGHTLRAYESDLLDFRAHGNERRYLNSIKKDDIRRYISHLREGRHLKEATIKRRLATLKLLFKWSAQEGLAAENPFAGLNERIRLPKRLPRALDRGDQALLRKAIVSSPESSDFDALRTRTAIQLLLETGIRVGELVSIDVADVSTSDACILIHGKGNRQRLAYISQHPLRRRLVRYLDRRDAVRSETTRLFVTSDGHPLSTCTIRRELRRVTVDAGITRRVTPHMLRHTCATQWLERGLDIRFVQKLLGHHSISTTEIYTHVSDQGLREALFKAVRGGVR